MHPAAGRALMGLAVVVMISSGVGQRVAVAGGKMYWTDLGSGKIQGVNLDGTGLHDLVTTGLRFPRGITVDDSGGKIYWVDSGTLRIQRANLDGSSVEVLVTKGLSAPGGITLDAAGGKMYWTDSATDKIQRANLDGSEVENLVILITRAIFFPGVPFASRRSASAPSSPRPAHACCAASCSGSGYLQQGLLL